MVKFKILPLSGGVSTYQPRETPLNCFCEAMGKRDLAGTNFKDGPSSRGSDECFAYRDKVLAGQ